MPPKAGMTQAQKLEKILTYFHDSATCHTFKDLEKSIPTATKVNKMQVKDLLQELTDTNQVKVEKIGSGNWYWAWAGEELADKSNTVTKLEAEETALKQSSETLLSQLDRYKSDQAELQDNSLYQVVLARLGPLEHDVSTLSTEKSHWEDAITSGVEGKKIEIRRLQTEAAEFTDNIYIMEGGLKKLVGLDKDSMDQLRMRCYGDSYVEGEDLPDIDDL